MRRSFPERVVARRLSSWGMVRAKVHAENQVLRGVTQKLQTGCSQKAVPSPFADAFDDRVYHSALACDFPETHHNVRSIAFRAGNPIEFRLAKRRKHFASCDIARRLQQTLCD